MKIGYKDLWVEFSTENLSRSIYNILLKLSACVKKTYSIVIIDDRYYKTGYICEYGEIKIKKHNLQKFIENPNGNTLQEIFGNNLTKTSGELNGYELNVPNLNEFDLKIQL